MCCISRPVLAVALAVLLLLLLVAATLQPVAGQHGEADVRRGKSKYSAAANQAVRE